MRFDPQIYRDGKWIDTSWEEFEQYTGRKRIHTNGLSDIYYDEDGTPYQPGVSLAAGLAGLAGRHFV